MTQDEIDDANRRSHEERVTQIIQDQRAAIDQMQGEIAVLRGALLVISEWRMPYAGFGWKNGSNGEREYMKGVARRALTA